MKKLFKLIILIAFVLSFFGCSSKEKPIDDSTEECFNQVTITVTDAYGKTKNIRTELYDQNNMIVQSVEEDGTIIEYENKNGLCMNMSVGEYRVDYKYNDKNELIESYHYNNENIIQKNKYEYDENGNRIHGSSEYYSDSASEKDKEYFIKYNSDNKMIEVINTSTDNTKTVTTYKWNNGNLVELNDSTGRIEKYDYDGKNQLIWKLTISTDNTKIYTQYEYDEQGRKIKETIAIDEQDEVVDKISYSYEKKC